MNVSEAVAKRRSNRTYKKQNLLEGTVEKLLEAARQAPSAGNVQPWAFVVVRSQKNRADIPQAAFRSKIS